MACLPGRANSMFAYIVDITSICGIDVFKSLASNVETTARERQLSLHTNKVTQPPKILLSGSHPCQQMLNIS